MCKSLWLMKIVQTILLDPANVQYPLRYGFVCEAPITLATGTHRQGYHRWSRFGLVRAVEDRRVFFLRCSVYFCAWGAGSRSWLSYSCSKTDYVERLARSTLHCYHGSTSLWLCHMMFSTKAPELPRRRTWVPCLFRELTRWNWFLPTMADRNSTCYRSLLTNGRQLPPKH